MKVWDSLFFRRQNFKRLTAGLEASGGPCDCTGGQAWCSDVSLTPLTAIPRTLSCPGQAGQAVTFLLHLLGQ